MRNVTIKVIFIFNEHITISHENTVLKTIVLAAIGIRSTVFLNTLLTFDKS